MEITTLLKTINETYKDTTFSLLKREEWLHRFILLEDKYVSALCFLKDTLAPGKTHRTNGPCALKAIGVY